MPDWPRIIREIAPSAKASIVAGFADAMPACVKRAELTSKLRLKHFLAQTAHESDGFRTTEEYASGRAYEGRRDLGNVIAGDGVRFKGRGLIQCTGRANYRECGKWLGQDFVGEPTALEQFPWAALSAAWFWATRGLNALADADDIRAVTKRINGGYTGLSQRRLYADRAEVALRGVSLASEPDKPAAPPLRPMLHLGAKGGDVFELQRLLRSKGFPIAVDGWFGPATERAVRGFQIHALLASDGIVGLLTWAALGA